MNPDPNCPYCHGTGTVYDEVDYGSTTVQMVSPCECAEEEELTVFDLVDEMYERREVFRRVAAMDEWEKQFLLGYLHYQETHS